MIKIEHDHFIGLSAKEARIFLDTFLAEAKQGFSQMSQAVIADGIDVDYTIPSLSSVFKWILVRLETLPIDEDESLPTLIRETDSYKKGLYSFDNASNVLILRFAYYMGECFVRNHESLNWSIGRVKTMQHNMPVVTGFKNKMELAVFVVSKNMFSKAIEEGDLSNNVESALQTWRSFVL